MKEMSKEDIIEIVHKDGDKWYFWNEIWSDRFGPFDSKEEAEYKLKEYAKTNLGVRLR